MPFVLFSRVLLLSSKGQDVLRRSKAGVRYPLQDCFADNTRGLRVVERFGVGFLLIDNLGHNRLAKDRKVMLLLTTQAAGVEGRIRTRMTVDSNLFLAFIAVFKSSFNLSWIVCPEAYVPLSPRAQKRSSPFNARTAVDVRKFRVSVI